VVRFALLPALGLHSSLIHRHIALSCLGKSTTLKSECPFIVPHSLPPDAPFALAGSNALISGGLRSHIGGSYNLVVPLHAIIQHRLIPLKRLLPIDHASPFFFFFSYSLALPLALSMFIPNVHAFPLALPQTSNCSTRVRPG